MPNGFKQGFTDFRTETQLDTLPITGWIPDWLHGSLLRNGPAQFDVGGHSYRHWFDGLAMLHRFTIEDGRVSYANRYLQSNAYCKDNQTGKINYRGFAVDPCRSLFSRMFALFSTELGNNANVNLTRLADDYIAMTETPIAVEFDPHTLATIGIYDYDDNLKGQVTTAHPHFDARRKIGINYLLHLSATNSYQIFSIIRRQRQLMARIPVSQPAYMHSFGMTEQYIILAEFSLVLPNVLAIPLGDKPFIENYRWMPERPTCFTIIDKDSGQVTARVETEAFFAFHHINAFERGDELIVDLCAYPNSSLIGQMYLDELRADEAYITPGEFRRYRVPLKGGRAVYEVLSAENMDLPRIHYRQHNARDYRYAYGAGVRRGERDFFNQLLKVDVRQGETKIWHEPGCYPGEPVFVPAPDAKTEDEGVVLSVVLDSHTATSFLLVQDAHSFDEIARAHVPHHVPFGFHGQFFA
jgi:carotenoid cleavage dioxygenase-like enzyme